MIVTRKKPVEQVLAMLRGVRRVALVGCASCATACQTGGEKELEQMRQLLQEQGIETVGTVLPDECCHMLLVKRDLKPLRDSGAEAIVCLACGDGTQTVAANTAVPVFPANDTLFLGQIERAGVFREACRMSASMNQRLLLALRYHAPSNKSIIIFFVYFYSFFCVYCTIFTHFISIFYEIKKNVNKKRCFFPPPCVQYR